MKDYAEGSIEKLKEINFNKPQSALDGHSTTIKEYFEKHPPATVAEAQNKIEELTGIKRSLTQINAFLKRIGMKCRTTGTIPGKAIDDEKIKKQESFKKKLEPRLDEAKAGKRALFFCRCCAFCTWCIYSKIMVLRSVVYANTFWPYRYP